ncbi:hypothetical protein JHK82_049518 [Glycine max]|nr:hypothetical protein JHK85_050140 [Glycine max]KAG5090740.1 hypothetical protein JHK82_049518 [Glycine max]KAG5093828.1 hypothetical protein JHK84_049416 [Glycine max]
MIIISASKLCLHYCYIYWPIPDICSLDLGRSELNRLNFQGFYTVLLERNEELISVAAVRVYGKKVTEVPPVGTRIEYRPHGMCHILMKKLEKKLTQLGVEGLILPAVPSVLETWTRSFGIAKMTNLERSQFLDYTFLDFQSAIMCQKLLPSNQSPDPVEQPSPGDQQCQNGTTSSECSIDKKVDRNNDLYKCVYTRRKVRKSCEGFSMPS